jgi:glycosyltransferase involved in cell wall biosynthesis
LLLVGSGDEEAAVRALAARLGVSQWVHLLGSTADAVPFVKHLDVCVLSSESEGLSNAVVEYLACGKPAVCTRVGGNPELIQDGESGFLVDAGDVEAMAERIARILSNPLEAQRLGRAAREVFEGQFTSDRMLAGHMALYERLAARR